MKKEELLTSERDLSKKAERIGLYVFFGFIALALVAVLLLPTFEIVMAISFVFYYLKFIMNILLSFLGICLAVCVILPIFIAFTFGLMVFIRTVFSWFWRRLKWLWNVFEMEKRVVQLKTWLLSNPEK